MKRKRLVIITNIPSPYRVAHYTFLQGNYKDFEIHIIFSAKQSKSTLRHWNSNTSTLENVHFLPVIRLLFKRKYDDRQLHITYGVNKVLTAISPDVVVCMEYNPTSIQTMKWCKSHKIPYISLTDGTLYSERNIGRIQKLSRKYIIGNADAFIASSTKAKEKVEGYGTTKNIYVSYLTTEIDKYLVEKKENTNEGQLLYVGSLIERKGVDLLLNALAQMSGNFYLKIVGTGPLEKELKEKARALKVDKRVEFCGFKEREELVELYKNSNVFVLPTREDCYGLVILEAMCASVPVLSSKFADGAYDLIEDGVDGLIVDPNDTKAFADKIRWMLDQTAENNDMGIRAYKHAQEFSFKKVSVEFMKAIEDTLMLH